MSELKHTRSKRYQATNSTNAAFAKVPGEASSIDDDAFEMGNESDLYRGLRIRFMGVGSDGNAANWKLWHLVQTASSAGGDPDEYVRQLFASGTATLSGTAGVSTRGMKSTEKVCDAATAAAAAYAIAVTPGWKGEDPIAFSEVDGVAEVLIPDFANADYAELEFEIGTATSINAMIEGVV